jgi:DNA end-binding protein Ku
VIQNKQHLAVLVPSGPGLILNLLRWGDEIRSWEDLDLPPEGPKAAGLSDQELAMAKQLVDEMTARWNPHQFTDSFKDEILALVERKVKAGQFHAVAQPEEEPSEAVPLPFGAQVLDLTDLLQRSLRKDGAPALPPRDSGPKNKPRVKTTAADGRDETPPRTPPRKRRAA